MMKTGICITGPAWIVRSRIATPAAHIAAVRLTISASTISAEQVDAVAADLHAGGQRRRRTAARRPATARISAASA